jgi:hypothetical protein
MSWRFGGCRDNRAGLDRPDAHRLVLIAAAKLLGATPSVNGAGERGDRLPLTVFPSFHGNQVSGSRRLLGGGLPKTTTGPRPQTKPEHQQHRDESKHGKLLFRRGEATPTRRFHDLEQKHRPCRGKVSLV